MSKLSDAINSPQPRNFSPRLVLSEVGDNVAAARTNVGSKPKQTVLALDLALAGIVKVIRGIEPDFDFGFTPAKDDSVAKDQAKLIKELEVENTKLRAELAKAKAPATEPLPVLEAVVPAPAAEEAPTEAPKRRGRPPKAVEPKVVSDAEPPASDDQSV